MLLSEVRRVEPSFVINMPSHEEHLLCIPDEASEPFPSEITDRLNREVGAGSPYTMTEIVKRLQVLKEVTRLPDGRWWTLKRLIP
jgi:hypothetical protein